MKYKIGQLVLYQSEKGKFMISNGYEIAEVVGILKIKNNGNYKYGIKGIIKKTTIDYQSTVNIGDKNTYFVKHLTDNKVPYLKVVRDMDDIMIELL